MAEGYGARSVNIPFEGFYDSLYSGEIDSSIEMTAYNFCESDHDGDEGRQPEELRLDKDELEGLLSDCLDYQLACEAIARRYARAFECKANEILGVKLALQFEEMTSPREYNFQTDRIFCRISWVAVKRLFVKSRQAGHTALAAAIQRRFTSRDGFISHYSNRLATWLEKPLPDWDHNELATLLIAMLESAPDYEDETFRWDVYYSVAEDCYADVDNAIDWKKFEAAREDLRRDKFDALTEEMPDYVPGPVRCPYTIDLFKGREG